MKISWWLNYLARFENKGLTPTLEPEAEDPMAPHIPVSLTLDANRSAFPASKTSQTVEDESDAGS